MTISFLPNLLLTSEYLNNLMLTGDFFSDLPWPEGCEGDKLFLEDFLDLASSFPGQNYNQTKTSLPVKYSDRFMSSS